MDYDDFFDTEDFDLLLDEIFNDDDDDGNLSNRLNFNDKVQTTEDSIVSKDGIYIQTYQLFIIVFQ